MEERKGGERARGPRVEESQARSQENQRERVTQMAGLYIKGKMGEGSPGPGLETFMVGGRVRGTGRSHGYMEVRLVPYFFGTCESHHQYDSTLVWFYAHVG